MFRVVLSWLRRSLESIAVWALAAATMSGIVRFVAGVNMNTALFAASAMCAAGGLAWRLYGPRTVKPQGLGSWPVMLILLGSLVLLYGFGPYDGMMPRRGGDGGSHILLKNDLVAGQVETYHGFVTFYSLWHWVQQLTSWCNFDVVRLILFFAAAVIIVAPYCCLPRSETANRHEQALQHGGTVLVLLTVVLPIINYMKADGFWSQLVGCLPVLGALSAYARIDKPTPRLLALFFWTAVTRYTYGLNLGDLLVVSATLTWRERRHYPRAATQNLLGVAALGIAGAALVSYGKLAARAAASRGGVLETFVVPLIAGTLVAAAWFTTQSNSRVCSEATRRAALFGGVFCAASGLAQTVYASSGVKVTYYFFKYNYVPIVLTCVLWPFLLTRGAARATRQRWVLAAVVLAALALGVQPLSHNHWRLVRGNLGKKEYAPLFDRALSRYIRQTLHERDCTFAGLLVPDWPGFSFMNLDLGIKLPHPRPPADALWFFTEGLPAPSAGSCLFVARHTQQSPLASPKLREQAAHWLKIPTRECTTTPFAIAPKGICIVQKR